MQALAKHESRTSPLSSSSWQPQLPLAPQKACESGEKDDHLSRICCETYREKGDMSFLWKGTLYRIPRPGDTLLLLPCPWDVENI